MIGRLVFKLFCIALTALTIGCLSEGNLSSTRGDIPKGFEEVKASSHDSKILEIARLQAQQYFKRRFPQEVVDKTLSWLVTPKIMAKQEDSSDKTNWFFKFVGPKHQFVELIVLDNGSIEGLDAGVSR